MPLQFGLVAAEYGERRRGGLGAAARGIAAVGAALLVEVDGVESGCSC